MLGVTKVNQAFMRQGVVYGIGNSQAADAGIKYTDRAIVVHVRCITGNKQYGSAFYDGNVIPFIAITVRL